MSKFVIAFKGHPGVGKSVVAEAVARLLRVPLIDKDDVRDCTVPLQNSVDSTALNDLAYRVIFRATATLLRVGLNAVVDSPLSSEARFHQLQEIAQAGAAKLLVVECNALNRDIWRSRLEQRSTCGHKPGSWSELETLIQRQQGNHEYDMETVPRLLIDTTSLSIEEASLRIAKFVDDSIKMS
eukprot:Protomagalhaensia_wolfi_Nauph_80__1647@NODE_2015_length_1243_cov_22_092193_g1575_i0_p1_GENE_NODE_2015_length_1243_cov_22_092193_g1575_i0NODE_2015_length_1243_cov_22_092193_g1575_i0_p1_ORF_typecomplete_len183_score17_83AAA_33/PF13671_6/3_2e18CPT/PF07931_12/1e10Zeta_toxin/PF06414_12/8_3e09AAA_16/PF13191_6/7_8e05CoaE/PF01121_20/0_11CoaE/PF01121_20/1_9CoaE/PF01121_20/2_8e03Cytidylate_kin/PF02224_18/0_0051Cytidylate_kin/PF02224_18/46AAA/PF00004_29/0_00093SKI/PF01202_22/0_0036AAA_22/PF13401_6/0_0021AP